MQLYAVYTEQLETEKSSKSLSKESIKHLNDTTYYLRRSEHSRVCKSDYVCLRVAKDFALNQQSRCECGDRQDVFPKKSLRHRRSCKSVRENRTAYRLM